MPVGGRLGAVSVLQALEAVEAQYWTHPRALDPAFQSTVVWPALQAADPQMPPALNMRGRPGEEHEWPMMFWGVLTGRIEAHRAAEAWSAGLSAQQVVLRWVDGRLRAARELEEAWQAQEVLERQMWGAPDVDTFTHLNTRLRQGVQAVQAFRAAVQQGEFRPALARLVVWESEQSRPARLPPQPLQQLQAWLDDTQTVIRDLQQTNTD